MDDQGTKYKIKVLKNEQLINILQNLNITVRNYIRNDVHKDLVDTLVLRTQMQLNLDDGTIESVNSFQMQKQRLDKLFEAVKAHNVLVNTAILEFLEILINFNVNQPLAQSVRHQINAQLWGGEQIARVKEIHDNK